MPSPMNLARPAYLTIVLVGTVALLVLGKSLIIPFILSLIVFFLITEIRGFLVRLPFVAKRIPAWLQNTLASLIMFLLVLLVVNLLGSNIQQLSKALPTYESNIQKFTASINQQFGIDLLGQIEKFMGDFDFSNLLSNIFNGISELFGNAFIVILYVIFLILEESTFSFKLNAIYSDEEELKKAQSILAKIKKSMSSYFALKTLVSVLTGVLSYFALLIIGIEAPIFWAFLIFILNYIPTIGSLIATVFPAIFAIFQFGELQPFILILVIVGIIQLVIGNFVEPKLMGNSLNISTLVVMISLSLWGAIWGVAGMLLSVPITVIMIIIFAEFKPTRAVAIMLSEKGKV